MTIESEFPLFETKQKEQTTAFKDWLKDRHQKTPLAKLPLGRKTTLSISSERRARLQEFVDAAENVNIQDYSAQYEEKLEQLQKYVPAMYGQNGKQRNQLFGMIAPEVGALYIRQLEAAEKMLSLPEPSD